MGKLIIVFLFCHELNWLHEEVFVRREANIDGKIDAGFTLLIGLGQKKAFLGTK